MFNLCVDVGGYIQKTRAFQLWRITLNKNFPGVCGELSSTDARALASLRVSVLLACDDAYCEDSDASSHFSRLLLQQYPIPVYCRVNPMLCDV